MSAEADKKLEPLVFQRRQEVLKQEASMPLTDTLEDLVRALEAGMEQGKFHVPNKRVAVQPLPETENKPKVQNGVLVPPRAALLSGQPVVFRSTGFDVGDVAFIRADRRSASLWGKEIFEVEGKKFILVPEDEVLLLKRSNLSKYAPGLDNAERRAWVMEALRPSVSKTVKIDPEAFVGEPKNVQKYVKKQKSFWARLRAWWAN